VHVLLVRSEYVANLILSPVLTHHTLIARLFVTLGKVRAHELRTKTKSQLTKQVEDLKKELSTLRVTQHSSKTARVSRIGNVRKNIARVLTVINQDSKSKLRAHYAAKGGKLPVDLREKKTRAIRRRLTPAQASKVTVKQAKKDANFPLRKYAVKA
jgi:large subunit ribosomal protein L35e